jgi:hypothetical protein
MMMGANMVFPGQHIAPADLLDMMERERVTFALDAPTISAWRCSPPHDVAVHISP